MSWKLDGRINLFLKNERNVTVREENVKLFLLKHFKRNIDPLIFPTKENPIQFEKFHM